MPDLRIVVLICLLFAAGLFAADRITGPEWATRSEVVARNGMVATSHPLAARIGIDILKKGGTAVDAAIAVDAALGLMEPTGSGVGGDLFALVWDAESGKLYGLNASGAAPSGHSLQMFRERGLEQVPYRGPLSWTVPGCVAGWFALHERFGKLPVKTLLEPTIAYARAGFPLTELIAHYWELSVAAFKDYPNFQQLYAPDGKAPAKGDVFRNSQLADTLELIGKSGADAFYRGAIARRMVDYSNRVGGYFTMEDLAACTPRWEEPLSVDYRGYRVWELPPNGQGIAALQMLAMLSEMDVAALGHNTAAYLHALVEIKKMVYEDRAKFYADPAFVDVPVREMISRDYALRRLKLFDPQRAARTVSAGNPRLETGDTVYLTVVDRHRNVVSLIQSNYGGFGSGNVPDGLGFCIQNRGALFSLERDHANVVAPGKRPFHTIIPAMVTKGGKPVFSFGVMGGAMQPQGHVQILCNIIDFDMNVQAAGDAPRFRHSGSSQPNGGTMTDGGVVHLESGISWSVVRELMDRGHRIVPRRGGYGGYQGIWIDHDRGVLLGGSESRKDGCALGY
ncbi:MAG TPA: gamma-glutamyltransferase [Candidatus Aminicenantes bacterium]|nr:gamma-glutamyltransferase [Candidatus Aminicenantes bacterium]